MRRIFFDSARDAELSRNGFVKVSLLRPKEAEELRSVAHALDAECKRGPSSYRLSHFSTDLAVRKRIYDELSALMMPAVDRLIDDFVPLTVNVLRHAPGRGGLGMHQHPNCVDETRFESLTIHVPLLDTTRHNGTLEVVPGSHRVFARYRGYGTPQPFAGFVPALKEKYCVPVDLEFGEAAIFYDSLVHSGGFNVSAHDRTCCVFQLCPREARTILYHWEATSPKRLKVYAIDSEFTQRYVGPERPEGVPFLGVMPYRVEALQEAEFAERLAARQPPGAVAVRAPAGRMGTAP